MAAAPGQDDIVARPASAARLTTLTSVYRFCERAIARRPRSQTALEIEPEKTIFTQTPQTTTINERTIQQYRFNLDI